MEWYNDSQACIEIAKTMLIQVEEQQVETMLDSNILPYLKVTIKNTLENCRSPLDYAATYISSRYPAYNSHFKHPQFPILRKSKNADRNVKLALKCNPDIEIINIIKNSQLGLTWLTDLTDLVNYNKHNNLSKQNITNTSILEDFSFGGVTLKNVTFSGNANDIGFNGQGFSGVELLKLDPNLKGTFHRSYVFSDIDKEVMPTLSEIIQRTEKTIDILYQYFNK